MDNMTLDFHLVLKKWLFIDISVFQIECSHSSPPPSRQPILEKIICCVEEIVVAQAACDALVEIIPKLPQEVVEEKCMGMIRRILEGESRFLGSSQPLDTVK